MPDLPNDAPAGLSRSPACGEAVSLEDILATEVLSQSPARPADYKAESEAMTALVQHMAESPETLLQKLAETAMALTRAGSAGVSIEETEAGEPVFRWRAVAGRLSPFLGGILPRHHSPCGVTVDRGTSQLMRHPERYYRDDAGLGFPVDELLLVPFFRHGHAVGTVWIVSHEGTGVFDAEDERLVRSLSHLASAALDATLLAQSRADTQLQVEEMHVKLESALEAGSIATWSWDIHKNRVTVDRMGARLFGVSESDARGGPISAYFDAMHPDDRQRVADVIQGAMEKADSFESEYRLRNGEGYRWVIARGRVLRDAQGRAVQFPGVLVDITARKDREEQQTRVSEALKAAHDQMLASSQAKDDFLAALSHELRTPLNPALLLSSEASKNSAYPRDARSDFEAIRKNIELEARLIDDLLDVTRISSGKFILYRALKDLHLILRDAADKIDPDAQEKKITLTWDLAARDSFVFADPVRLQQVFWNVLKNAVKFTPAGGSIHLRSENTADGRHIRLQIQDSGIGLEYDELESIFEAFAQGHHAIGQGSHTFGGLGLGLAISRKIVEAHAGLITATSRGRDQGATFAIELPTTTLSSLGEPAPSSLLSSASQPRTPPLGGPAASLRILMVEDHADTRRVLQRLLTRRGHEVAVAACGEEALNLLPGQAFDLLICDVGLPDTDGYTLLGEILHRRPGLPAIAMTGYGMESDVERSAAAGFLAHLTKPVSVAALEDTLRGLALGRYGE